MGNLFGGGGGNPAQQARAQERARQLRIGSGLGQINSIYGGGQYGVNPVSGWDSNNYMNMFTGGGTKISDLSLTDPTFAAWAREKLGNYNTRTGRFQNVQNGGGALPDTDPVYDAVISHNGGSDLGPTLANAIRQYSQNLQKSGLLFGGVGQSKGFNDEFYNNRAQQYENYALPQLATQYGQAQKDMVYNLANKGLLSSSSGTELNKSLQRERLLQQQGLADTGIQQSQQLRQNVEGQRSSLIAQLEATGDPSATTQQALTTVAGFNQPGAYTPIGNLFTNWANTYLARQYSQAYNPLMYGGGGMSPYQQNPYQQNNGNYIGSSLRTVR